MKNKKKVTVPIDVRRAALRAIKTGQGLEAVSLANRHADEINKVSFYATAAAKNMLSPYQLV